MIPNYKKLYIRVASLYKQTHNFSFGEWDESFFTLLVFESCKKLLQKTKLRVNEEVLLVAAIVHDIGKVRVDSEDPLIVEKELKNHPELGIPLAREILEEEGYPEEFIEQVAYLVKYHDTRKPEDDLAKSNELMILQDADLLADMGLVAFVRPFLYSGKRKQPTLDNIKFIQGLLEAKDPFTSNKILAYLNLKPSKKLAKKLLRKSRKLNKELIRLTQSELLA